MNDKELISRPATKNDISFLVDTVIEAEKSGSGQLSYSTIFGLSETEVRKYIKDMLLEEVDGCELSISSFIIIEDKGIIAAASAAWIEGFEGIPSTVLKANLLNFTLPKECFKNALKSKSLLQELHIEFINASMHLGLLYVSPPYRGLYLTQRLIDEQIKHLSKINPHITEMYLQVYDSNIKAIKAYERANFKVVMTKECSKKEILNYLPSTKKILMRKNIN